MTHQECRCCHCGIRYSHQTSGDGCGDPLNDGRYCPDCKNIINKALHKVPKAVEKIRIPVDGEERNAVLAYRDAMDKSARLPKAPCPELQGTYNGTKELLTALDLGDLAKPNADSWKDFKFPRVRQIAPGLYDTTNGASMDVRVVRYDGAEYYISTWTDNREPEGVSKMMERNLETGEEVPWKNLH